MRRHIILLAILLSVVLQAEAQKFFNLTAPEVRIDSLLPVFSYRIDLGTNYADSIYEVSIDYPEFIDMSAADVARYQAICDRPLPEMPQVEQTVVVERKRGWLEVSFVPLVMRHGRYQKLVSFSLKKHAKTAALSRKQSKPNRRYANHSVLAEGQWAKIRVPATGIYQLTDALLRQAGFSHPQRVRIYGYGGALQPEALTSEYLATTDDLKEVPTCTVGGRRLFRAIGPVSWETSTTKLRTRNYCSDYGYYFLTESDEDEPLTVDSTALADSFYPSPDDYHSLYEDDSYAWYHGGRNLYSANQLNLKKSQTFTLDAPGTEGRLSVAMTYNGYCSATVTVNDSLVGTIAVNDETRKQGVAYFGAKTTHSNMAGYTWDFDVTGILHAGSNTIQLQQTTGVTTAMRLDHLTLTFAEPKPMPSLSTDPMPVPEFVYRITNQDHHADEAVDMVIIIPTTQKLLAQAQRLKTLHEEHDSMSVRIVPADELYNEFSSGTPDPNAYRRYMKMLYDRAESEDQLPTHLLLMGDGAWDNRMLTSQFRGLNPDDFLLCFESENSFSETYSYVSEEFFGMLDDGEIVSNYRGKPDVAIGRISARTAEEAKIVVDKTIGYVMNEHAGSWQNTICIMADDGNVNQHMADAEVMASTVNAADDAFYIKKVYWDMFTRQASSTGNRYPEAERILKQQMKDGALIMNYSGHGAAYCLSHEMVFKLADFKTNSSQGRLPLWVTASCDVAPFDTHEENIAEEAVFNPNGGAIAFLGTTRTVFMTQNRKINQAFMKHVLGSTNGRRNTIGEALRLAKNDLVDNKESSDISANKMHYVLLGDPAIVLAAPTQRIIIDSLAGKDLKQGENVQLSAGSKVTIVGHVQNQPSFSGIVTAMVLDAEETIVCKLNEPTPDANNETNYEFQARPNIIYNGSDSLTDGRFRLTFVVPKDISYSDQSAQLIVYATNNENTTTAHGQQTGFTMDGDGEFVDDGIGPSIYCYLNSPSFQNGGTVNATPFFFATITDKDGINAAGSGIGHDLELIIDGDMTKTYNLNSYFQYDFGNYSSGSVGYSLPELSEGQHKLLFRAWDILNNPSTAELSFVVDPNQTPELLNIVCLRNPASTSTRFVISHNRAGCPLDVTLEVFDTSGRKLWERRESGIAADQTYAFDWDLTISSGYRLKTGVYLYRILVASDGSKEATMARKLIVTN